MLALALLTGCAAGRAFQRGEDRARVGDWDSAVTYYRQAMQAKPSQPEYRIALERAMLNASRVHFDAARALEAKDQLDAALQEYRRTVEFDPGNTQAIDRIVQLERVIRDRIEASRPKPPIVQLRDAARQTSAAPLLNPASRAPLDYRFTAASLRDILTFISNATGINVIYDASFQDRSVTVTLSGSIEQVLNTLLSSNGLFYSVQDERTIVVALDSAPNRLKYERQVALTIPLSYVDATELTTMLTAITRTTTGVTIPPVIIPNKTNNSITIRATEPVIAVIRELVITNDKPRAEITLDVEILEVSRTREKELGVNLSANQIGAIFSPEQAPPGAAGAPSGATGTTDGRPFNLNTITSGRQHRRLLPDGTPGGRQVPRHRRQHAISGHDAAARFRRRAIDAESRCGRAISRHTVFANRRRRAEYQSGVVVQLPNRWHQRAGDASPRHRGRRHSDGPDHVERHARSDPARRRRTGAIVSNAQRHHQAQAARRRVPSDCRPSSG